MLKSNVCDILSFSGSCFHPLTIQSIVSTYLLHQGDSFSGLKVSFSEASDKAAIKKKWGKVNINAFWLISGFTFMLNSLGNVWSFPPFS